jgi:hypothetical protein
MSMPVEKVLMGAGAVESDVDRASAGAVARERAKERIRARLHDEDILDDRWIDLARRFGLLVALAPMPNEPWDAWRSRRQRGVVEDRDVERRLRRGELVRLSFSDKNEKDPRASSLAPGL